MHSFIAWTWSIISIAEYSVETAFHKDPKKTLATLKADWISFYLTAVIILGKHLAAAYLIFSLVLNCNKGSNNWVAYSANGKNSPFISSMITFNILIATSLSSVWFVLKSIPLSSSSLTF